ncbi:dihydrofolate reductase family protein [Diaminobutyricibacter sp. McL0608]|uniref:dihydrofolate reductase family protein n=1 Tax=Leifsonia sp. McL0608 TaxID=3143537 RepID=UPI0031F32311
MRGDVIGQIAELKRTVAGEIIVYGSRQLIRTLLEHDLVDEVRLTVFPVVLGSGERLFDESAGATPLRLTGVSAVGDGLARLTYAVDRESVTRQ